MKSRPYWLRGGNQGRNQGGSLQGYRPGPKGGFLTAAVPCASAAPRPPTPGPAGLPGPAFGCRGLLLGQRARWVGITPPVPTQLYPSQVPTPYPARCTRPTSAGEGAAGHAHMAVSGHL